MNNPLNFIKGWGITEYLVGGLVFVFLFSIGGSIFQSWTTPEAPPVVNNPPPPEPQTQAPSFQVPEIGSSLLALVPMIGALYAIKSRKR